MSLVTRHLDFETLHHHFGHASNEVMCHVLNNVKDAKKICFQHRNISAMVALLERYTNAVSLKTLLALVSL